MRIYDDVVDCAIRVSQVRLVYDRQRTNVTGDEYYILGPQGRHEVLEKSGENLFGCTFEHCTLSTNEEVTQLSVLLWQINNKVFDNIPFPALFMWYDDVVACVGAE